MRKFFIVLSLLELSAQPASAEPSPATRWLMNEPMTLMDWGLFKASKSLDRLANVVRPLPEGLVPLSTDAEYDWDENKIRLKAFFFPPDFMKPGGVPSRPTSPEECEQILGLMLKGLLIGGSRLSIWFAHDGFSNPNKPNNLYETLDKLTSVEVVVPGQGEILTCSRSLLGGAVSFTPKKY